MVFDSFRNMAQGEQDRRVGERLKRFTDEGNPLGQEENKNEVQGKLRVLVFIDWYLPAFRAGGPVRSLSSLVSHMKGEFEFFIITSDRDLGDTKPYSGIKRDEWIELSDSVRVFYCSEKSLGYGKLGSIASSVEHDVVYLNSFFSRYFSVYPLLYRKFGRLKKPVVLAPRGMLGKGALALKSVKKRLFISISKMLGLHKDITWHSTSVPETKEIKGVFGEGAIVKQAFNFPAVWSSRPSRSKKKNAGELKLFFLSRIARKKNLLFAAKVLAKVKSKVEFSIYGPVEDLAYWSECQAALKQLPPNIRWEYKGELDHERVRDTTETYHCLLLPTLNENFGHVIFESLSNGCPVLISDQTPWRALEEKKAGADLSLNDVDKWVAAIEQYASLTLSAYSEYSEAAMGLAASYADITETFKKDYRELFS